MINMAVFPETQLPMKRRHTSSSFAIRPFLCLCLLVGPVSRLIHTSEALPFVHESSTVTTAAFKQPRISKWRPSFSLSQLRGGSSTEDDSFYAAVGVQVVPAKTSTKDSARNIRSSLLADGSHFMLLKGDNLFRPQSLEEEDNHLLLWNGDDVALESLAVACDIMVLIVEIDDSAQDSEYLESHLTHALERGLRQRAENGMKSSVVVLLVSKNTANTKALSSTKMSLEKDRLVLQDLNRITSHIASNLDILSLEDPEESNQMLETTWNDLLQETKAAANNSTCGLVEAEAFPLLLQNIYQSKKGKDTSFLATLKHPLVSMPLAKKQMASNLGVEAADEEEVDGNQVDSVTVTPEVEEQEPSISVNEQTEHTHEVVPETEMQEKDEAADEEQKMHSFLVKEEVDGNQDDSVTATPEVEEQEPSISVNKQTEHTHEVVPETDMQEKDEAADEEQKMRSVLVNTQNQIRELEAKQEERWLGFDADDGGRESYMEDFGPQADRIIDQFQSSTPDSNQAKQLLFQQILPSIKRLFDQHLQFVREHCGKQYEAALQQSVSKASRPEDYQGQWKEAAGKITKQFREAAMSAIPIQCREGGSLRDADFDYVPILEGLLQDMMQATEEQEELLGLSVDEEDDDENVGVEPGKKQKRPAKWYHKVAAKAVVFGVNYLQGWLAYQGIKRAAAQRDLHLPKFPLF